MLARECKKHYMYLWGYYFTISELLNYQDYFILNFQHNLFNEIAIWYCEKQMKGYHVPYNVNVCDYVRG